MLWLDQRSNVWSELGADIKESKAAFDSAMENSEGTVADYDIEDLEDDVEDDIKDSKTAVDSAIENSEGAAANYVIEDSKGSFKADIVVSNDDIEASQRAKKLNVGELFERGRSEGPKKIAIKRNMTYNLAN